MSETGTGLQVSKRVDQSILFTAVLDEHLCVECVCVCGEGGGGDEK